MQFPDANCRILVWDKTIFFTPLLLALLLYDVWREKSGGKSWLHFKNITRYFHPLEDIQQLSSAPEHENLFEAIKAAWRYS